MEIEKFEKNLANLYDKKDVKQIINLNQALNHWLVHGVIKFDQEVCLKPYIDIDTDVKKNVNHDFEKYFFKLMNNTVFSKTVDNVRKKREIEISHEGIIKFHNQTTIQQHLFAKFISHRNEKILINKTGLFGYINIRNK